MTESTKSCRALKSKRVLMRGSVLGILMMSGCEWCKVDGVWGGEWGCLMVYAGMVMSGGGASGCTGRE